MLWFTTRPPSANSATSRTICDALNPASSEVELRNGARPRIEVDLPKPAPEFVDLSLPSGTLCAADYLRDEEGNILYLPYNEAKKYNLPTKEQVQELIDLPYRKIMAL